MRIATLLTILVLSTLAAQDRLPPIEHLSPAGIPKPLLIVHGELPKDFENTPGHPVANTQKDSAPTGFQFLRTADDSPRSGLVGLHVPPDTVLQLERRVLVNVGRGTVTVKLAKSDRRPARTITLEPKDRADINELRRCAMERAAGSPYPPAQLPPPIVPKGTLVIVGGGGMTPAISKRFIEAGGGEQGHFVVLPIAMPDPIFAPVEAQFLKRLGAKNVTVIPYREQKDLEDPKVRAVFEKATGIWFGGGRQWHFVDAYEGTQLPAWFRGVLDRGGVIGGSSAGATIQGDYLVRGAPAGPQIMMCEGYERGLGFLPGVAIDQHFSARKRFKDMTALMAEYPQYLGIGLDEATAIIVQGSTAEILGKGQVHFYDRKKPVKPGEPDYDAFPDGVKYDLVKRKKLEP